MKRSFATLLIISSFLFFHPMSASAADNKAMQIKKQTELQQVKPKKLVKIKLKYSPGGKYTWDLTGDNVDEIVRADRRLRKLLNIE